MKTRIAVISVAGIVAAFVLIAADDAKPRAESVGYDDTPTLPNQPWRVHDIKRPHPRIVTPGTPSTQQQPGLPPSDA
ncbi:MAG: hypothetical protein M3Z85_12670, partial [Acidobacteriota bacterium]|nr:hypothetical protein [Acidobacteriota bacterium]